MPAKEVIDREKDKTRKKGKLKRDEKKERGKLKVALSPSKRSVEDAGLGQ